MTTSQTCYRGGLSEGIDSIDVIVYKECESHGHLFTMYHGYTGDPMEKSTRLWCHIYT